MKTVPARGVWKLLKSERGLRTVSVINKFEPLVKLSDVEDEEDWDVYPDDAEESSNTWTVVKRKSK